MPTRHGQQLLLEVEALGAELVLIPKEQGMKGAAKLKEAYVVVLVDVNKDHNAAINQRYAESSRPICVFNPE